MLIDVKYTQSIIPIILIDVGRAYRKELCESPIIGISQVPKVMQREVALAGGALVVGNTNAYILEKLIRPLRIPPGRLLTYFHWGLNCMEMKMPNYVRDMTRLHKHLFNEHLVKYPNNFTDENKQLFLIVSNNPSVSVPELAVAMNMTISQLSEACHEFLKLSFGLYDNYRLR